MFTILENYKALLKMCVSAQMAGGPEMSFAELDGDQDTYFTKGDYEGLSTEAQMAAQRVVENAGFDINQIKDGTLALTEGHLQSFLKERGEAIAGFSQQESAFAQTSPGTPETTVWHTETQTIPATYQPAVQADAVSVDYGTVNTVSASSGLSAVTDASVLASLGDAWQEGLRVDNFNGKNYVVEGGVWKTDTGISGTVETAEVTTLTDYKGRIFEVNKANAVDIPQQAVFDPSGYNIGQTYKFQVNGETKYAVWMEVKKGCPALSEPPVFSYEQGTRAATEYSCYVCENGSCGQVPVEAIPQTYIPPVYTQPAPEPVYQEYVPPAPQPIYTAPQPQPAPVQEYIAPPAPEPQPLPETVERCLNVESYLQYRTEHYINSDFYNKVILRPTAQDKEFYNRDKGYLLTRDYVKITYDKVGYGTVTEEVPALIVLKDAAKGRGREYYRGTSDSSYDVKANKQVNFTDYDGDRQYDNNEPYQIFDSERCTNPFNIHLPDPINKRPPITTPGEGGSGGEGGGNNNGGFNTNVGVSRGGEISGSGRTDNHSGSAQNRDSNNSSNPLGG